MADKKISDLNAITGANTADGDLFVIVDTSANETKSITKAELFNQDITIGGNLTVQGTTITIDSATAQTVDLGDNDKIRLGDGDDLQIYHDGTNSYIDETGTGNLIVQAENIIRLRNSDGTKTYASFVKDAAAKLYYANAEKLATTNTGIDVTGTVDTSSIVIDTAYGSSGEKYNAIRWNNTSFAGGDSEIRNVVNGAGSVGASLEFYTDQTGTGTLTERMKLHNNGDISFYEDTGTTAKFFWDASAESLYLGNTNPSFAGTLDVTGTITSRVASAGQTTNFNVRDSDLDDLFRIITDGTTGEARIGAASDTTPFMTFYTGASEAMRINSSGNVGIGTTSPGASLDIANTTLGEQFRVGNGSAFRYLHLVGGATSISDVPNSEAMIAVADANFSGITGSGDTGFLVYRPRVDSSASRSGHAFFTGSPSVERMRIDSSGNVGIGVTPEAWRGLETVIQYGYNASLHTYAGLTNTLSSNQYIDSGSTARYIQSSKGYVGYSQRPDLIQHQWLIAPSGTADAAITKTQAMTLDASGNLLVGLTSGDPRNYTTGGAIKLAPSQPEFAVADFFINKTNGDGNIVTFRSDATTVGSIGANSGSLFIASPYGTDSGLRIGNSNVSPATTAGAARDAAIDLGYSSNRFKDLYLSGGVYLGGTGAANHLDDYEEGTWTPTCDNSVTLRSDTNFASYVKVGNMVMVSGQVRIDDSNSASALQINNLPFASYDGLEGSGFVAGSVRLFNNDIEASVYYVVCVVGDNSSALQFQQVKDNAGTEPVKATNDGFIMFGITYRSA